MNTSFPKPERPVGRIRELLRKGLWPYAADPAPVGLLEIGSPPRNAPLIVEGNSRHALGRLRRVLLPIGGRALVVETGGRDLYTAFAEGTLRVETVVVAVEEVTLAGDTPPSNLPVALLPYPIYQEWNEAELSIAAGPANAEDLPAFLASGQNLTEEMKRYRYSLRERLHLILAHAALLLLVAVGPLLYVGGAVAVGVGFSLVLISGVATTLLPPKLHKWTRTRSLGLSVVSSVLFLAATVSAAAMLLGYEPSRAAVLCGIMFIVSGWFSRLALNRTFESFTMEIA